MAKQDNLNDQDVYKQGIYAREELSTTGIGEGIAIPHAQSVEEFMDLINQKEAKQKAKEEEKEEAKKEFTGTYRLLAVTACPTGIAHTYMAAEALEEKAKQMGITIKVETDGSSGTKNAPTAKEIEECEAIIVAADKNVEMARFDGKPVIQVKVAD